MNWFLWLLLGLLAAGLAAAIWGIGVERHLRVVRYEEQPLPVLPRGSDPIRVLHISDLHVAPWQFAKLAWIAKLSQLDVDMVINTGDNLGQRWAIKPLLKALSGLMAKPGAFVNGSNDYFAPQLRNPLAYLKAPSKRGSNKPLNTARMTNAFETAGWLNLNNRGGILYANQTRVGLVGVDDYHDGLADLESIRTSKRQLLAPSVLLGVSHAPYLAVIDAMNDVEARVLFAGHTHGGQVCIPGFGALTTNCDLPTYAAKGLSSWSRGGRQLWLNVCAGLGHSIYAPVRFACRPEVRVVTLVGA